MIKRDFHYRQIRLKEDEIYGRLSPFAVKFAWFMQNKYFPHYFQQVFHSLQDEDQTLLRHRHLVAGRRGGKTISAAWEVLFYCLFPGEFHWDAHGNKSEEPLHVWVLTKDYPTGRAAWATFLKVIRQCELVHGTDFKMNKGDRYFEFPNGSLVEFKTAEDPESLRGAGLDILWIDEAAFIPTKDAYVVARPALSDKQGWVLTTTTPDGKNWLWDEFFAEKARQDDTQGRVEYRSLDNPYFPREEWEYLKKNYHPLLFKREFMAAFDALAGHALSGEWLKYYTTAREEKDGKIPIPRKQDNPNVYDLTYFMGVDPAISLSDDADSFAMALLGVTKDHQHGFLIRTYKGKIPFPEQIDKITEWHVKYKPQTIGVEAVAYQRALVQQLERLPGFVPVIPVFSQGKKPERIMRMSPLFKLGRIRISESMNDFIDEWLSYDDTIKNPKDDLLDATEIAIAAAGSMLPPMKSAAIMLDMPASSLNEWAMRDLKGPKEGSYDPHLGDDW